jgi:predicted dehydrogenase
MSKPLNVAVIGLGYFSQFHLDAWADLDSVQIAGVTDPDPRRRDWAAQTYGTSAFADLDSLSAATDPDIVDIVAPPPAHLDLIRRLACKGRIMICQKPFCTSLGDAEAATAVAEAAGAMLIIHENFRFQPWYRTLKAFLDSGQMGAVYQCRFALRPGDGRGEDAYLNRQPGFRNMPRLLIHETGVHFIDLFRWLFGEITAVYADLRQLNPVLAGEDAGVMLLDHASGVRSQFDGNRLADHDTDNPRRTMGELLIEGETGAVRLDGQGRLFLRSFGMRVETSIPLISALDDNSFGGGCVAALISHVVAAARGDARFENSARSYLPVIRVTEAAYTSAETGRRISFD